jgi:hypothetical protein
MAGSDPAGRPLRARLGHRQRPQGPSLFLDRSQRRRIAATPAPQAGLGHQGILVGVVVLEGYGCDWRKRLARPSTTKQGG